jgi:outer membrane protein OmpA-like peptidoglycan-associated protein
MLTEKGYGATKPKAENTTPEGKFQNRRIEYTVIKKG